MKARRALGPLVALCVFPLAAASAQTESSPPEVAAESASYPSLNLIGFADAGYSHTDADDAHAKAGFFQGQLVGHCSAALSSRFTFFAEVSVTASGSAYGGYGSTAGHAGEGSGADLHRSVLKYAHSDALKLSIGRFHTPIAYWNSTFHHGQWLQTTVTRPKALDFSNPLLPLHFIGAVADGKLPSRPLEVSYLAGIGNGRGGGAGRPDAPGDTNNHRAWVARLSARPKILDGIEIGGAIHEDQVHVVYTRSEADYRERIWNAYVALTGESPELIAEYVAVRHRRLDRAEWMETRAYYVQAAWRVSSRLKPYARWEDTRLAEGDHALGGAVGYRGVLAGVRVDASDSVALKAEYHRREDRGAPFRNAVFAQASLTF